MKKRISRVTARRLGRRIADTARERVCLGGGEVLMREIRSEMRLLTGKVYEMMGQRP